MITNLISPTHQTPYTLDYILAKGLIRSGMTGSLDIEHMHKCFYWSNDFCANVYEFGCTASRWTDSVVFFIDGSIPLHTTENGKLEYGFQCGCDLHHGGQFPSDAPPDNPKWDEYKKNRILANIYFWVGEFPGLGNTGVINMEDIPYRDPAEKVIVKLVATFLARQSFAEAVEVLDGATQPGEEGMLL